MVSLYQIQPDGTLGRCWAFERSSIVIGRGELAEIQIDDQTLSRSHFLISREGSDYFLVDLDSQNGTWLDGRRVKGEKLHSGDVIRAGEAFFYFSVEPVPAGECASVVVAHVLPMDTSARPEWPPASSP